MSRRPELRALTSVRGIAAWFVVLYHIRRSIAGLPEPALHIFAKGYLAVDFFFLLSGFVIWMTYADRIRDGGLMAVPEFLKRRIARIWPLHLFVLTGGVLLVLALAATGRHDPVMFPFAELPLHYLLLQNWGFTDRLTWNDPAWSISAEMAAYLLFPLLALAIDWRRLPSAVVVAAIAALLLLLATILSLNGATTLGSDIAHFGLIRCLFEFTGGTAVCALWLRWRDTPWPASIGAAAVVLLAGAGFATGMLSELIAVPVAFAALLLVLALTCGMRGNILEVAPLHYLGEISYATYLGHFLLWFAFKLVFVSDAMAVSWSLIALFLAMVLVASAALYHGVERPAQRWINRRPLPFVPEAKRATALRP
ncbi:acyltransferase [Stakelama sediminis]|uniref:Peptidoglycan/LPS O-acetylase OafA/YrhL n=1 Tax=Stakelama sediminis TaxID=463200 RepID=A0A840Z0L3_9SPHN|nr:acyltransferase [Stakelama sediminis]MBB5719518.1 peptidoglycan/LPS O-acetylase OafA/YrhL [Stakelama sediminis]